MAVQPGFVPEEVAALEAAGWRAYYDRKWLRLLTLVVRLAQDQFAIPFPRSLLAAYYVVRASMAWAPRDHDTAKVQRFYERFYRMAARYSGLRFDPALVARLETEYNAVHRRLSGQFDKTEFVQTMVALHSAVFGLSAEAALPSAELRVLANNTVDLITSGTSTDIERDWALVEDYLRRCYRAVVEAR